MRLNRSGGTREIDFRHFPLCADVNKMIHIAHEIFFPDGRCTFGALSEMDVPLAKFKCDRLETVPLTLQCYTDACKATRIRFYIQTKRLNSRKENIKR